MKRKSPTKSESPAKRAKFTVGPPSSSSSTSVASGEGDEFPDWPAPSDQIEAARRFIRRCVELNEHVLIVPDKDADGMSSGKIMHHTLTDLGLSESKIRVFLLPKATSVHDASVASSMLETGCTRFIILDQGSRPGPPIFHTRPDAPVLILDHHVSPSFPLHAVFATACHSPPIATTSMLTYRICEGISDRVKRDLAWVAVLGIWGDLGQESVKWGEGPWPGRFEGVVKTYTKKALNSAISMMNGPQRTAEYNVDDAWRATLKADTPQELGKDPVLLAARARVSDEVERCTHVAPKFSKDGRVALLRIHSGYRVHPLIATRWAAHLKSAKLEMVMVANTGYSPLGTHTHFSCRLSARVRKLPKAEQPSLIEALVGYGKKVVEPDAFFERVGGDFAKGHAEATGGIILTSDFELFCQAMEIGVKPDPSPDGSSPAKSKKQPAPDPKQRTISSFFASSSPTKPDPTPSPSKQQ